MNDSSKELLILSSSYSTILRKLHTKRGHEQAVAVQNNCGDQNDGKAIEWETEGERKGLFTNLIH